MPERGGAGDASRLTAPALLILLVGLTAALVRTGWTLPLDRALLRALAPAPGLVAPLLALTWLGDTVVRFALAGAVALALGFRQRWRTAAALVGVVAGGAALNSLAKLAVARPRPDVLAHLDHVASTSFPSGHAAGAVTTYVALALLAGRRRWLAAAIVLATAIGISRVALAVHWPSDVLAGWLLGAGWVLLWRPQLRPPAG